MKGFRFIAGILALILIFSSVSVAVSAAEIDEGNDLAVAQTTVTEDEQLAETGATPTVKISSVTNTADGAKIVWKAVQGASSYAVYLYVGEGYSELARTTELSYVHTSVNDAQAYSYNVRALDGDGNYVTEFASTDFENIYYSAPVISSAASSYNGVSLKWSAADDTGVYRVYRSVGTGSRTKLADVVGTEYVDTTAVSGKQYTYSLRRLSADGRSLVSDYSASVSVDYVQLPAITSIENTSTGAKVTWTKPASVQRIRLYYHNGTTWIRITETTGSSYVHDKLTPGTKYRYTVRGVDNKGNFVTDFYKDGWENTFIEPPVISSLNNTASGTEITWNAPKGAVKYRVFYKTGGSEWKRLADTDKTSYLAENNLSGAKYTYTVRCINEDGSVYTSYYTKGKDITYVSVPEITGLSNTATGTEIAWKMPAGADRIRVYYRADNTWVRLTETTGTKYVHDKLKAGTSYLYTLRCVDKEGNFLSDFNHDGWSDTFFAPPVIKDLEATDEGIKVTWNRVKGAEDYRLFRKTDGTSWTRIIATDETSFVDKTVKTGVKYTYTLRMVKKDGETYMSYYNSGKSITYSVIPVIKKIENTAEGAKITWDATEGADYYRIYYKNSDGGWTRLASKYKLEYVDTSVKDGETRVYTIRCLNEKDEFVSGFSKTGWSNTFYSAPAITSISYSDGSYKLSWKATDGVAAYRVYRRTVGESFSRVVDSVTESTFTDTTATKGKVYAYTLRCLDAEGNVISGFVSKVKYYKNGKVVDGNISQDGTYGFKEGYLLTGLNRVGGRLRYYNDEGRMYRDTIIGNSAIGYYYVDPDGVCIESSEMCLAAEFMKKHCKGNTLKEKFKYGYLYIAHNFDYERRYTYPTSPSDLAEYATDMFTNHSGDCYRYAVCVAYLAKIAGYRTLVGVGEEDASGGDHGWTEVYVNGRWLICDAEAEIPKFGRDDYSEYMVTNYGHVWGVTADWYGELVLKDGKAVWQLF